MRIRVSSMVGAAAAVALVVLESRRPLRRRVASRRRRVPRNLLLAAGSAVVVNLIEEPLARSLARRVDRRRQGLLAALRLPRAVEIGLGVLLLDYTLYQWHRLTHRVPLLWRHHAVHHEDPDLDLSTGIGFSPVEMLLSVPYRLAQVRLLGVGPAALGAWKAALFPSILFHHSNLRLPLGLERALSVVLVTPRMHGIHHSQRPDEQSSNWSSFLSVWDRLHGTLRLDVPQETIRIGLPVAAAGPAPDVPR